MKERLRILAAGASDRGRTRRIDEDAYLVNADRGIFAVADGVGGNRAGEVASRLAVDAAERIGVADPAGDADTRSLLGTIFSSANEAIRKHAESRPETAGMATTLVVLRLDGESAWIAHCGDSRAYRWRPGSLEPLTRDHSIAAVLTEKSGVDISPTQSPFAHVLTKCLGKDEPCEPEIQRDEARPGDRFLLCCDGLTDMVKEKDIAGILAAGHSPEETCARLIDAANAAGGQDNITVVVVDIGPGA